MVAPRALLLMKLMKLVTYGSYSWATSYMHLQNLVGGHYFVYGYVTLAVFVFTDAASLLPAVILLNPSVFAADAAPSGLDDPLDIVLVQPLMWVFLKGFMSETATLAVAASDVT